MGCGKPLYLSCFQISPGIMVKQKRNNIFVTIDTNINLKKQYYD